MDNDQVVELPQKTEELMWHRPFNLLDPGIDWSDFVNYGEYIAESMRHSGKCVLPKSFRLASGGSADMQENVVQIVRMVLHAIIYSHYYYLFLEIKTSARVIL